MAETDYVMGFPVVYSRAEGIPRSWPHRYRENSCTATVPGRARQSINDAAVAGRARQSINDAADPDGNYCFPNISKKRAIKWITGIVVFVSIFLLGYLLFFLLNTTLELQVKSVDVSIDDISASEITATWNVGLWLKNPWLIPINSGDFDFYVAVFYQDEPLAQATFEPVRLKGRQHKVINATMVASVNNIGNDSAKAIAADSMTGTVAFNFQVGLVVEGPPASLNLEDCSVEIRFLNNTTVGFTTSTPKCQ